METARPTVVDAGDVIIRVTGSTICGSDLHLLHGTSIDSPVYVYIASTHQSELGAIPELHKGDILGHEFCGVVEKVGPQVQNRKVGERVVASFQIACGECFYCKEKLSSICERTNGSVSEKTLYGRRTAGMLSTTPLNKCHLQRAYIS